MVGQDAIAQTLKNAIRTGRVAHAYLFTGTRGVGKTTMARILAKSLNCLAAEGPTTDPCCKCESCLAIHTGDDIDVIEIDGASNRGIDNIRELRQNAIYRPARSRYKIYIIDEVHMLTTESFNALLKTLEEPPSHVKFIFATTEPNKVIPTIQSRCQRFDFNSITPAAIAEQLRLILKAEKIEYEDELVLPLAKMANGSMRDALSLLDRLISTGASPLTIPLLEEFLGCADSEKVWKLVDRIAASDAGGALAAVDELLSAGSSEVQVVDSLIDYMRDLMVVKSAGADSDLVILTAQQRQRAIELAERFDIAALVYGIAMLEKLRWSVKNADNARALLEASLLRLALSEHFMDVDKLISQLQGEPAGRVKKKPATVNRVARSSAHSSAKREEAAPSGPKPGSENTSPELTNLRGDIHSIKENWQAILNLVAARLGRGTAGLLSCAVPRSFEDGVLRLEFPAGAKLQKQMCEQNGRIERVRALLAEEFARPLTLSLELAQGDPQSSAEPESAETPSRKRAELINDPAVKAVLLGLNAKVIDIEEK